jgi:periplasmic copper chaperone A
MTLTNGGKRPDRLLSIASPLAKRVEMHQTSMQGGVMSMRRLDTGLPLGPGESVSFAPGGYHLMLVGLTKPLRAGDKVPATLVFSSGARLQITFPVLNAAPSGTSRDHMVHQ